MSHMRPAAAGPPGSGPLSCVWERCRNRDLCCPRVVDAEAVPLCFVFGGMEQMARDTEDVWEGRVILWVRAVPSPSPPEIDDKNGEVCSALVKFYLIKLLNFFKLSAMSY